MLQLKTLKTSIKSNPVECIKLADECFKLYSKLFDKYDESV